MTAELAEQIKVEIADHRDRGLSPVPLVEKYVFAGVVTGDEWNRLAAEVSGIDPSTVRPIAHTARPKHPKKPPPNFGPGTELQTLAASLDVQEWEGCSCEALKNQMNAWGVGGCRKRFHEIVGRIKDKARQIPRRKKLRAAWRATRSGLVLRFWRGPYRGLVEEAIRRSERKRAAVT